LLLLVHPLPEAPSATFETPELSVRVRAVGRLRKIEPRSVERSVISVLKRLDEAAGRASTS
jgi:hypothetical protein